MRLVFFQNLICIKILFLNAENCTFAIPFIKNVLNCLVIIKFKNFAIFFIPYYPLNQQTRVSLANISIQLSQI